MLGITGTLLNATRIDLDVQAESESDAIPRIARLLDGDPSILDFPGFCAEVLAREKICATAMGNGVAFPHARTDNVSEIVMAAGRSSKGIKFTSCGRTVNLIFLIGAPIERVPEYLALVGGLARALKEESVRAKLMNAATAEQFVAALR